MRCQNNPVPAVLVALLALARPCDPKAAGRSAVRSMEVREGEAPLLPSVIAALDRLVTYYEKSHHLLHLDGIFGAKAIEGQLNLVVAKHNKGLLSDAVDYLMKNELAQMATRAGRVVRLALPHLQESQPVSMHRLRRLFQLSWDIGHSHRRVDLTLLWDRTTRARAAQHSLTDSETDRCLAEVLEPTNGVVCGMSQWCQEAMTQPGHASYGLTHQILYSIVAEMSGCGSRLEQWLVKHKRTASLEQLQAEMCANLYVQACSLPPSLQRHPNPAAVWDLFLEMEFVCGMLGYSQFLQEGWLMGILHWQDPSGCFKATPTSMPPTAVPHHSPAPSSAPPGPLHHQQHHWPTQGYGCLAHLTGVAASSLAVHLHSLLYAGQSEMPSVSAPRTLPPVPAFNLQPPPNAPIGSGIIVNRPLFRGDIHSGLNRVASQERSLEDKADLLLQRLEEEKKEGKEREKKERNRKRKQDPKLPPGHSRHLALPELAVPLSLPVSVSVPGSVPASPLTAAPSPAPLWCVAASVVLVAIMLARYVHSRRRRCNLVGLKGKFRL
ncbi:LOW QUALITY PROTEIN: UPF0764 protein C16orf89 homolog [Portunus trituberculatus]|uniref:LOW QUALITY PROTEIN: UPF0764 protein C16orf89 homolog n=1 Tax=Portunus trituberculatus TaxID=210409 RepID=UPI001E1CF218|nr:LOW QUALITY PROTEIN: UPF0764 protein C16orf89 homolog [Portunus trituberculatus]